MKKPLYIFVLLVIFTTSSFSQKETAIYILQKVIKSIDTIETVYYKQDMTRTNPRDINQTIFRYRDMFFKRLISDSIVGLKGHWNFYNEDKSKIIYEDIYDGNKLIRKNNRDSLARVYNLIKFPAFKETHFWSHNTPFTMLYTFKYVLENKNYYRSERLNDTIFRNTDCFQILITLEDKQSMLPGFGIKLEDSKGSIERTLLFINKETYYPIRVITENYSKENPKQKFFVDQTYYDLRFNFTIDENKLFNTSEDILSGFRTEVIKPGE